MLIAKLIICNTDVQKIRHRLRKISCTGLRTITKEVLGSPLYSICSKSGSLTVLMFWNCGLRAQLVLNCTTMLSLQACRSSLQYQAQCYTYTEWWSVSCMCLIE